MALLEVRNLGLVQSGTWIFRGIECELDRGEGLALVGLSGAGKSSLLHVILGLVEPTEGHVVFEGAPWSGLPERLRRSRRNRIQGLLQEPMAGLPPHRTGWEILETTLRAHVRIPAPAQRARCLDAIQRAGLAPDALDLRPTQLSGGMALRLALARALVVQPALLVLDEPHAGLDGPTCLDLEASLRRLQDQGLAWILATHDLWGARRLCRRVLHLEAGQVAHLGSWDEAHDLEGAWRALPRLRIPDPKDGKPD